MTPLWACSLEVGPIAEQAKPAETTMLQVTNIDEACHGSCKGNDTGGGNDTALLLTASRLENASHPMLSISFMHALPLMLIK